MPLTDHLRELRSRLSKSLLANLIGTVVGWFYYDQLFGLIRAPFHEVVAAEAAGRDMTLAFTGVADPFLLQFAWVRVVRPHKVGHTPAYVSTPGGS